MNITLKINGMEISGLNSHILYKELDRKEQTKYKEGDVIDIEGELLSCVLTYMHGWEPIIHWDFVDRNKRNKEERLKFVLKCVQKTFKGSEEEIKK